MLLPILTRSESYFKKSPDPALLFTTPSILLATGEALSNNVKGVLCDKEGV